MAFVLGAGAEPGDQKNMEIKDWGQAIDPEGDCEFKVVDKRLHVIVPGTYHDLHQEKGFKVNGPRVQKEVEGDFIVSVRVSGVAPAAPGKELAGKKLTYRAGSLLLWIDERNFVRLDRGALGRDGKGFDTVYFHVFKDGKRIYEKSFLMKEGEMTLRIERRGRYVNAAGIQGKYTQTFAQQVVDWPAKFHVALGAINVSTEPLEVTFDAWRVDRRGEKK